MREILVEVLDGGPVEVDVEETEGGGQYDVEMRQYEPLPVDNETAVDCAAEDWALSGGYSVLTLPQAVHKRGASARASGAESDTDGGRDAVVSYKRLPNGTILIYSNIPFAGRIFVRG